MSGRLARPVSLRGALDRAEPRQRDGSTNPRQSYIAQIIRASADGPFDGDRLLVTGRVGAEVSVEQAYEVARATGLSILALA
jgi:hypothetical protein